MTNWTHNLAESLSNPLHSVNMLFTNDNNMRKERNVQVAYTEANTDPGSVCDQI